jgi:2-hydroxychromene-2-carboxylate isomerase
MNGRAAALYTSEGLASFSRRMHRVGRALTFKKRRLVFFHRVDDPQSHLLALALGSLAEEHGLDVELVLVPAPAADVDPEPQLRAQQDRADAVLVARRLGYDFPPCASAPVETRVRLANAILLVPRASAAALTLAVEVGDALLRGEGQKLQTLADREGALPGHEVRPRLERAYHRLRKEGHYQGAVVSLDGEHFQGVLRLPHVRERLGQRVAPERLPSALRAPCAINLFFSFRSPYSYLALERLARAQGSLPIELTLRPVMPMVMRGLPVPSSKRAYVVKDAAREARRYDIPFGHICDPVGDGVERCLALFVLADAHGKGVAFARAAMRAIWSEARDLTEDAVLMALAAEVGIDEAEALASLRDESFREVTERNRERLYELGHWGVPVLEAGTLAVWGQDHLALVLDAYAG